MSSTTFNTFKALASAVSAEAHAAHQADIRAAQNLRRSAPLRKNRAPGTGPAIARTSKA